MLLVYPNIVSKGPKMLPKPLAVPGKYLSAGENADGNVLRHFLVGDFLPDSFFFLIMEAFFLRYIFQICTSDLLYLKLLYSTVYMGTI